MKKKSAKEVELERKLAYNDADLTYGLTVAFTQFYTGEKAITESVKNKFVNFFNTMRFGLECGIVNDFLVVC